MVVSHRRLREVITYYTSPTRRIGQILNGSSDVLEHAAGDRDRDERTPLGLPGAA